MAIPPDSHYIPAFSIEDVLLDKDTGAPLTGGVVTFYRDSQRLQMKPVYQITGTSPDYTFIQLPNPMTLSAIGTFEDALENPVIPYFFPYTAALDIDLYYITVESSGGVAQFVRQAQPYIPGAGSGTVVPGTVTNELSNPQFAEVLFDTEAASFTYNFSGVTDDVVNIAPDWSIVVTSPGAGTVTVSQLAPLGALNLPTNPGTLLQISSTGVTSLKLRQRIIGSPNLWGKGYISAGFMAKVYGGTAKTLTLNYSQSNGTIINKTLVTAVLPSTGNYAYYPGSALIDMSDSNDDFPDAYIDIFFDIPLGVMVDITSVMAVATGAVSVANVGYDQESNPRQIDHLFHYYNPQLQFKPIPSLLTGWDFPLNPAQLGTSQTMTTTAGYIWDQTIGQSVVGNIAIVRGGVTGGFQATTANASEAFYIMQYLSGTQAQEILGNRLAVNLNAFRNAAGGAVVARVYLYRGSSSAAIPTLPLTVGGATPLNASGVFTLNSTAGQGQNWTLIARNVQGTAYGTLPVVDTTDWSSLNAVEDLRFSQWEITDATQISNTNKFAIVVTFTVPTSGTVVTVDSCSLVKGDIATRPAAQTITDVLSQCQYYYQNSKDNNQLSPICSQNSIAVPASGFVNAYTTGFSIEFKQFMRTTPTLTMYNTPNTSSGVVSGTLFYANAADAFTMITFDNISLVNWVQTVDTGWADFKPATIGPIMAVVGGTSATLWSSSAMIAFHYIADARLGIV